MEVTQTNRLTDLRTRTTSSRPSRRRELYQVTQALFLLGPAFAPQETPIHFYSYLTVKSIYFILLENFSCHGTVGASPRTDSGCRYCSKAIICTRFTALQSAGPRIDCRAPASADMTHVRDKQKREQRERERQHAIQAPPSPATHRNSLLLLAATTLALLFTGFLWLSFLGFLGLVLFLKSNIS